MPPSASARSDLAFADASTLAFVFAGVALNCAAQLLLKAGVRPLGSLGFDWPSFSQILLRWPIAAGLGCYVVSVGLWIVALSRLDVSVAYPMLSLGYVINAVVAWWLFDEPLGPQRLAGIALILGGVTLLARN